MWRGILEAAGGLGLFLVGMLLLTEGLRALAGEASQRSLRRFTRSPLAGAVTGMLVTTAAQSSSITTVSAVGFAGAGLLTFPQALGIVLGANVGSTTTGWLVAVLGFKLEPGLVMPVAILAGALLRLLARGRLAAAGQALAGFGLIFVGIDALQGGMGALAALVTPERFPGDSWLGRGQLVLVGIAITLVTQSSSAGVAMALAAVSAGAISLAQAAALVIGFDVGTSAKAAFATLGASLAARRTGWAHVIYNLLNAVLAFAILPLFLLLLGWAAPGVAARDPELALVGFHTFFNVLGVAAVLPLAAPFARLVERLVPDRPGPFTRRLDRSLLREPELALRAVAPTLDDLTAKSFEVLRRLLREGSRASHQGEAIALLEIAVAEVQRYLAELAPGGSGARRAAALHVVDQLRRLLDRLEQRSRAETAAGDPELRDWAARLEERLPPAEHAADPSALADLERAFEARQAGFRQEAIARAERRELEVEAALARMDAFRWLEHVTHHAARIAHHAVQLRQEVPGLAVEPPERERPDD